MPAIDTDDVDRVCGVDFSGAADAGTGVWVTAGRIDDGGLTVERCGPAPETLAGHYRDAPTTDREATLAALERFIGSLGARTAVGIDFPFGLPERLADGVFGAQTWADHVRGIAGSADPDALRTRCRDWADENAEGTYLKRATDVETGAFSPYHWFVAHQTYHGAAGLLEPLLDRDAARFVPMQADRPVGDRPLVFETYPAATLDRLGLYREAYKTADDSARKRRVANLDGLRETGLTIETEGIAERVIGDHDGDGLDSLVAAVAGARFLRSPRFPTGERRIEGHIYV